MPNRLADAVSPYLRSHADNPVDWQPWASDAFDEATRRDVPVFISIGYSTCHWCHVMARETFSDPELAAYLNANFVSIKVDREEHPDVDSSYLAAAGAFTEQLGWPLTVFATPTGRTFFAGTYFPPAPVAGSNGAGLPSFREVLEAIRDAWTGHRAEVEETARQVAELLAGGDPGAAPPQIMVPVIAEAPWPDFDAIIAELEQYEDREFGGFGSAPKFPIAPVLGFLLGRDGAGASLARRALEAMAASDLRDPVEGGFFRYSTRRDWSDPHYERMLYDNALLLDLYARAGMNEIAEGIAAFLLEVMRLPGGGFASAQDSESTVDGTRVEGGYYALDAEARAGQAPPALDEKVLTGWNGLAIGALASAGARLGHPDWVAAAVTAADLVAAGPLVRARIGDRISSATATLEDFGMLADGLTRLALATGEVRFADRARELVEQAVATGGPVPFAVPGDPVLSARGLALAVDPSEGAYPSGLSSVAAAAARLRSLGASRSLLDAASGAMRFVAPLAAARPMSFGAALELMTELDSPERQLVVVTNDVADALARLARGWTRGVVAVVTEAQARAFASAGFELFEARVLRAGLPTAYLCENFVCQLPVTSETELAALLAR